MQNFKVKVCGMRKASNIKDLIALNPDFIGFIFYEKSLRNVTVKPNVTIPNNIKKVGVFVNKPLPELFRITMLHQLDYVQLHGDETPNYCKKLQDKNVKIIKAFNIDGNFDFNKTIKYAPYCTYFLFDASGKLHGGNGRIFNWNLLKNYTQKIPFLLSGGIDETMVKKIKKLNHPKCIGIDINSKFEIQSAIKNIKKIESFIKKLNQS